MPKYPLDQIKAAYVQKKDWEKQFPISNFLFRPISFYVTYLVIRITESPSRVAWVGFSIGVCGCFSLLFIPYLTIWAGISLLALYALSDAVDGNIARVTENVTYYGKYLDGMMGIVIEGSYCFWLGLGLYLSNDDQILYILTGITIMTGWLYSSLIGGGYEGYLIQKQKENRTFQESLKGNINSSTYRKRWCYLLFINLHAFNLQLIVLSLSAATNTVHLFLLFFATYYLARVLITMVFYIHRAQHTLY